jgi:NAD(P)-dependent dehydrogenase (short-subunit alcohol dehydrogenase family)
VYIVANTPEDLQAIESESRVDIRPLRLDISDVRCQTRRKELADTPQATSSHDAIEHFSQYLNGPHRAFQGASPHNIMLVGLIMIPDTNFTSGPVEALSPDIWSDALNTKVLATVATTQAFLRLLCNFKARLLVLTPGVIPALSPPFHGVETSVVAAIEGFTKSLQGELRPLDVDVCQIHLGNFDCHGIESKNRNHAANASRADTLLWSSDVRAAYAKNFYSSALAPGARGNGNMMGNGVKGSDLRELHNAVFDALTESRPRRTWRVGSGSLAYGLIGKLVPTGVVGWMLGIRRVQPQEDSEEFEIVA